MNINYKMAGKFNKKVKYQKKNFNIYTKTLLPLGPHEKPQRKYKQLAYKDLSQAAKTNCHMKKPKKSIFDDIFSMFS